MRAQRRLAALHAVQIAHDIRHFRVAVAQFAGHRPPGDFHELFRSPRIDFVDRFRRAGEYFVHDNGRIGPFERLAAGQQLVEQGAERVDVAPRILGFSRRGIRRQVGRRTFDRRLADVDHRIVEHRSQQSEVGQVCMAVTVHEDVGRLQIAMDDPAAVRVAQRLGDLSADAQDLFTRQRLAVLQAVGETAAGDEGHDIVRPLGAVGDLEYPEDVRVRHLVHVLGLGKETAHGPRFPRELGADHLDRHARSVVRVLGEQDLSHAARTEQPEDPESADHAQRSGLGRRHHHAGLKHRVRQFVVAGRHGRERLGVGLGNIVIHRAPPWASFRDLRAVENRSRVSSSSQDWLSAHSSPRRSSSSESLLIRAWHRSSAAVMEA